MADRVAADAGHPSTDVIVREFRQILLYPLQLVPMAGRAQTAANWERLMAHDCAWHDAADEPAGADPSFAERHYSEFVAFMPDVQRFLYGEGRGLAGAGGYGASPIRVFRRNDVVRAAVTLRRGEPALMFEVARVELYFFYDIDLAILAVEVVGKDMTLAQAQDTLFRLGRAYPASWDRHGGGSHCCHGVQLLDEAGEVLVASDYEHKQRYLDSVAEHRAPYVAAHWSHLLDPLAPQHVGATDAILYRQVEQQHMPFLAFLAVDDPTRIGRDDWVRLGLAAPPGPPGSSPLGSGFLSDFEARYCYDRFWDPSRVHDRTTTRMICSGHAFVMVGDANDPSFANGETGILAKFRHQYFLLALIANFHRATLLAFRDRLVSAMSVLRDYHAETVKRFKREIRLTHENFLRFTHRYWFHDVSNQGPARDLFERWVAELGTDRLFAEVRDEVNDMIDYLDSDGLRRQANSVVRLTVVTFFGLIGTVATGFLGMNLIDLTRASLPHKLFYFIIVLVPVAALTFYTAAKSQRLSEFLEAVSDARLTAREKLRALARVWKRKG
ncbi:MAG: hypothetical protein ABW128_19320 [Rhizorhabdus sp.]